MSLNLIQFFKEHQDDIVLLVGVILISLLSFALGYIIAKQQEKEPVRIEYKENVFYEQKPKNSHCWSRDLRDLSGLEII
ncbi:MAG: hypothetical protein ACKKMR_01345 [Candidatus Nealsonbacteria bacterium]